MTRHMIERRHTLCNRDCPDACGIVATVRDGRATELAGDPDHPVTRGFLCYRTRRFLERQYSPERLTRPLMRRGGKLQPVSWDAALELAAERLSAIRSESGPASILHYRSGGTLGLVTEAATDTFFERFGPVTATRGSVCSSAGEAAQTIDFGVSDSSDLFDLQHARNVLLWGKNAHTSSPHTFAVLRRAQGRGARLVLIDPVAHRTASLCERTVQPRPGGDFALAMAVARVLFERGWTDPDAASYCDNIEAFEALSRRRTIAAWCELADVPCQAAEDLARRLGQDRPTAIVVGWGMVRRAGGGAIVRALDALGAVSGNLGISGGGVSYYFARRRGFARIGRGPESAPRSVCEPLLGDELLGADEPPIRAVWVTAGNPVAMLPQSRTVAQALRSRELVVVVDSFVTDTAELADLVLPTTTLLEADELLGAYGHHYLGEARPVVPPPEGVKSDLQIVQALAARVGLGAELAGSARDWKRRLLGGELGEHGVTLESLAGGVVRNPMARRVLFADRRFPTATGRVNLIAEAPDCSPVPSPSHPLVLMALSTPKSQCAQWVGRPPKPLELTVHPSAAAGLADGALGRLQSARGSLTVRVRHDPRQRRDVALVPKGGHLRDGSCANALLGARTTDLGEGGALYDEPVRLCPV